MALKCRYVMFVALVSVSSAFNLRSKDSGSSLAQMNKTENDRPDDIPDPSCKRGVVSPDLKACCAKNCGRCGTHKFCGDVGKYNEATGLLADECCKERVMKMAPSCEKDHPPCVLSPSYKKSLESYKENRPKRHAQDDCNKAVSHVRLMHSLAIDKGDFYTKLYLEGRTRYQDAKALCIKVRGLCEAKTRQSKELVARYEGKIAGASDADKEVNQLSGTSMVGNWEDKRDMEQAEVDFYAMIIKNSGQVEKMADKGIAAVLKLKGLVQPAKDVEKFDVKLNALIDDAQEVYSDAELLWQQWLDSTKDYNCSVPASVEHAEQQCADGNTKYSPRCDITCELGYTDKASKNLLRCNKQGKFGEQLYGEWMGMGSCVGMNCGMPTTIAKSKNVLQEIRYPNNASYVCYEGFSMDRQPDGPKAFEVGCDEKGNFMTDPSQACQAITCGKARHKGGSEPIDEEFTYTQVATYECLEGFTTDATPGGFKSYGVTCQATGKFTEGLECQPVMCGGAPAYANTELLTPSNMGQTYSMTLDYRCLPGYSLDQKATGNVEYTLTCRADGEFQVGLIGDEPLPSCRPVSAGIPGAIAHGSFNRKEMFYGESVVVTADEGYSISGDPGKGVSFTIEATADGKFKGEEPFVPVSCGSAPVIEEAPGPVWKKSNPQYKTMEVVFGDLLSYACAKGYSLDTSAQEAMAGATIQCESDGSFSKVPGLRSDGCLEINDCLYPVEHNCGPFGTCEDHHLNYTCNCDSGYEVRMDNKTEELICGNIDDCGPEACGVGNCKDLVNDYKCICPTGYEQTNLVDEKGKEDHTCTAVLCGTPPEVDNSATSPVELAGQKMSFPQEVLYQCDLGHTTDATPIGHNHFEIKCQPDKSFTAIHDCKAIVCPKVPVIEHATVKESSAKYGERIRYDCAKGHTTDGTADGDKGFTIECLINAEFGEAQRCIPVSCGEPEDVANGNRPSGTMVYGDKIEYMCAYGFTLDGDKDGGVKWEVKCKADGTLSKNKQCLPKVCGEPKDHIHALYASTRDEGPISFPMNTEVICRDGYTVGGSAKSETTFLVKCTAEGVFAQYNERECEPVRCGAPPIMHHAVLQKIDTPDKEPAVEGLTRSIWPYSDVLETVPDLGKRTSHIIDVVSAPDSKVWSATNQKHFAGRISGALRVQEAGKYTFAMKSDSGAILYIDDKEVLSNPTPYVHSEPPNPCGRCTVCVDGPCKCIYMSKGGCGNPKQTSYCMHPDTSKFPWTGRPFQNCELEKDPFVMLDLLEMNSTSRVESSAEKLGGPVSVELTEGPHALRIEFVHNIGNELLQLTWTTPDGTSEIVPNSVLMTKGGNLNYEETAIYECVDGYTTGGEYDAPSTYDVQCLPSGELSFPSTDQQCRQVDACERHTCGPKGVCIDLEPYSAYTCKCNHGYEITTLGNGEKHCGNINDCKGKDCGVGICKDLVGDYTCTCPTGYQIGVPPGGSKTCMPVKCLDSTPSLPNGKLLSAHSGAVNFPTTLRYKCNVGYSVDGTVSKSRRKFQSQCKASGQIYGQMSCQKISCGTPHVLPFTTLTFPESVRRSIEYGDKAKYECVAGYTAGGRVGANTKFEVKCQDNGVLTDPEVCQPVRCGIAPSATNARPSIAGDVFFGVDLYYRCSNGYTTDSTRFGRTTFTSGCKADATFTQTIPNSEFTGECYAELYEHGSFDGWKVKFPIGDYNHGAMTAKGAKNDQVSSLKVIGDGCNAELFKNGGFNGWNARFSSGEYNHGAMTRGGARNDDASSIKVFQAGGCKGISAGNAPTVQNARLTEYGGNAVSSQSPEVVYPNGLEYRCNAGFSTNGAASGPTKISARVNSVGAFTPALPAECKQIVFTIRGGVKNARSGSSLRNVQVTSTMIDYIGAFRNTGCPNPSATINWWFTQPDSTVFNDMYTYCNKVKNNQGSTGQKNQCCGDGISCRPSSCSRQSAFPSAGPPSSAHTASSGFFALAGIGPGAYNIAYEVSGFIADKRKLKITGNMNTGGPADIAMSPAMAADQWRAVLKWGAQPRDLDTHVTWSPSNHVYYARKVAGGPSEAKATLEQDRTQGYGPETLYMQNLGGSQNRGKQMKYEIYDYTRRGNMLSTSDAQVTLYNGNHVVGVYKISQCARWVYGGGNWWHVFTIDAVTNRLSWNCVSAGLLQTNATMTSHGNMSSAHK